MKAILFSSDFTGLDETRELEELVGKPAKKIRFAVINEAVAVEHGDNSFFVDGMHFLKHRFGGFELVNLLALPLDKVQERISEADAIFCFGGNTEYLKTVFDKTGFSEILPELLKEKVWCGSSAGSMILGKMVSAEWQRQVFGEFDDWGVGRYLELLDFSILPHLRGGNLMADEKDVVVFDISRNVDWDVYTLSDWSAVVVDGEDVKVVGKYWARLRNGEILEQNKEEK
ncbi:Type 1 glutamine amidotransferase-like domain-containing protein [Candidatus Saccharibacteria bacterium]|nr:Type 1 glutamine amidotransferase-like domain-containing protein [Candidatus Saccharibacteria bacterium]